MMRFRKWSISVEDRVIDTLVREAVRNIDLIASESHYLLDMYLLCHGLIDSEARNIFSQG